MALRLRRGYFSSLLAQEGFRLFASSLESAKLKGYKLVHPGK